MTQPMKLPTTEEMQAMSLYQLKELHKNLADTNDTRMQTMEAAAQVTPDPLDLLYDRIDLMLLAIFPGDVNRLRFELSYEIRVQQKLNRMESELGQKRLQVSSPTLDVPRR